MKVAVLGGADVPGANPVDSPVAGGEDVSLAVAAGARVVDSASSDQPRSGVSAETVSQPARRPFVSQLEPVSA
jgi:hypothetical protein